jgi:hypothetical protein
MAERAVRRQTPEVGAGCLNWARPDLCGGRGVTRVPTAIIPLVHRSRCFENGAKRVLGHG